MLIVWNNIPFDILTQIAGFLIANLAIAIMMVAAIYLNFKLPASYRTRAWVLGGAVLSTVVLIASGRRQRLGAVAKAVGLTGGDDTVHLCYPYRRLELLSFYSPCHRPKSPKRSVPVLRGHTAATECVAVRNRSFLLIRPS